MGSSVHASIDVAEGDTSVEEGPSPPPVTGALTLRHLCCYGLMLVIGLLGGMVANELAWVEMGGFDPLLGRLDAWLNEPHDDPGHGGEYCADGLIVEGPARTGRNTLTFLALLMWTFLGVAIAADIFMAGIEQITSAETTKTVVLPSGEVRRYTITVWNATVANLSLMALGSSAPEILLSCIEIAGNGFYAGELGPSTIVGSAAFNMLVISAVCITAIPDGGSRSIKELPVFYLTAAASLLAYVWLIIILVYISPNFVEPWEGIVTFIMFPLLVYVAYRIDVGDDEPPGVYDDDPEGAEAAAPIGFDKSGREISKNDVCRVLALQTVEKLSGDEQLAAVASMLLPPQSRAYYRKARRDLIRTDCHLTCRATPVHDPRAWPPCASCLQAGMNSALGNGAHESESAEALRARILHLETTTTDARGEARVEWAQGKRTCREAQGHVELAIVRKGDPKVRCSVDYKSESGSATEGVDYEKAVGTVHFAAGEMMKTVTVKIYDDNEEEDDEHFNVQLLKPVHCRLGVTSVCDVTIQVRAECEPTAISVPSEAPQVLLIATRCHYSQSRMTTAPASCTSTLAKSRCTNRRTTRR